MDGIDNMVYRIHYHVDGRIDEVTSQHEINNELPYIKIPDEIGIDFIMGVRHVGRFEIIQETLKEIIPEQPTRPWFKLNKEGKYVTIQDNPLFPVDRNYQGPVSRWDFSK